MSRGVGDGDTELGVPLVSVSARERDPRAVATKDDFSDDEGHTRVGGVIYDSDPDGIEVEMKPITKTGGCGENCFRRVRGTLSDRKRATKIALAAFLALVVLILLVYFLGFYRGGMRIDGCFNTGVSAPLSASEFSTLADQKVSTWQQPVRSAFNTYTPHLNGPGEEAPGRVVEPNSFAPPLWGTRELTRQEDEDGRRLQIRLVELQNPPDCKTARILYYPFFGLGHGFGSEVHWMGDALAAAVATNRTLVLAREGWAVFGDKVCDGSQFFCYFMPWGKCNEDKIGMDSHPEVLTPFNPDAVCQPRIASWKGGLYGSGVCSRYLSQPMEGYQHRLNQWWRGQLMAYQLRPNQFSADTVMQQWNALGLNAGQRFIAMHVRHGEKLPEAPQGLFPLVRYTNLLQDRGICRQGALGDAPANCTPCEVFVSSEDPAVMNCTKDFPYITWRWTDNPRENQDTWVHVDPNQPKNEALISVWNLYIAIAADDFIGTYSSNWSRLIYELMLAIKGDTFFRAYSLDTEWFYNP